MIFKHAAFLLQKSNFLLENNLGLKQHAISKSTVHYLFSEQPRISARRYKNFLECKLLKKDNSLRIDTSATYSIHSRVRIRLEHLTKHAKSYVVVSADTVNKIHVGTLAVSR